MEEHKEGTEPTGEETTTEETPEAEEETPEAEEATPEAEEAPINEAPVGDEEIEDGDITDEELAIPAPDQQELDEQVHTHTSTGGPPGQPLND